MEILSLERAYVTQGHLYCDPHLVIKGRVSIAGVVAPGVEVAGFNCGGSVASGGPGLHPIDRLLGLIGERHGADVLRAGGTHSGRTEESEAKITS